MIYFIRHGQTDWNVKRIVQAGTDIPLNDVGREQARTSAQEVAKLNIEHIYSSPLSRAFETAEIINAELRLGLPVVKDDRLREWSCGDLEGMSKNDLPGGTTWHSIRKEWKKYNAESAKQVFNRTKNFIDEIINKGLQNVLVVGHAGVTLMAQHYAKYKDLVEEVFFATTEKPPANAGIWKLESL